MSTHVNLSTLGIAAAQNSNASLDELLGFGGVDASDMRNQITIGFADPLRASLGFYEVTINGKTDYVDRQGVRDIVARFQAQAGASVTAGGPDSPRPAESRPSCEVLPVDQDDPSNVDDPMADRNVDLKAIVASSGELTWFEVAIQNERHGIHSVVPGDPNGKTISTGPVFTTVGIEAPNLGSLRAIQCIDPQGGTGFAWMTHEGNANEVWSRDGKLLDAKYDGTGYSMQPGVASSLLNPVDLLSGAAAGKLVGKSVTAAAGAIEARALSAEAPAAVDGMNALEKGAIAASNEAKTAATVVAQDAAADGMRGGINWNPFRAPSLDRYMPNSGNVAIVGTFDKGGGTIVTTSVDFLQLQANHGGRIFASTDLISNSHVDQLANDLLSGSLSRGKNVVILTGRHGTTAGWDFGKNEIDFLVEDFGIAPGARNLEILDATKLTSQQMKDILQRGDDVILGWCHSENSRQVMNALGVNVRLAPF
jgi:hypothetical protein